MYLIIYIFFYTYHIEYGSCLFIVSLDIIMLISTILRAITFITTTKIIIFITAIIRLNLQQ